LARAGYEILARNFRARPGEIDIIAKQKNQIILVEVKTRSCSVFGFPEEAVNKRKLIKIKQVGEIWLSQHRKISQSFRVDLIAILGNKIKHYKNISQF
jgi:putative endonuclease